MKVGFVGVGAMGAAMAGHVLRKGRDQVFAYDVRREAVDELAPSGVQPVDSIDGMAAVAELIIVMVVSDTQVLRVVEELTEAGSAGALISIAATIHPGTVRRAAEVAGGGGFRVIDAPVCFGLSGAREGRLVSLCGGAREDVDAARDVMLTYGRAVHHLGPLGSGQIAKTVNNMLHWAACVANYEALLLAKRHGIDAQALREVLLDCPGRNGTLAAWDTTRFTWPEKDMDVALDLAQEGGLTLPLYGQVDQLVKLLDPAAVRALLYEDRASYLGRDIAAKDAPGDNDA